uniref:Xaa-Pro aminopeptidase 1-like n=1 Tax=Hirondellea gigas TaxID=1518452 RepID=A0A2P2I282_9CRUS
MDKQKADLLVVTALDEVAWLLNLRADDIPYNPVFRSYIMLSDAKMTLFLDSGRITPGVDFHLHVRQCIDGVCFSVTAYDNLVPRLKTAAANPAVRKVLLPKKYSYAGGVSYAVYNAVPSSKRLSAVSPVLELKARKNEVEFQGMKNSHLRDAVALVDFLAFLEKEIEAGNDWDEISAATKLEEYRAEQDHFVGLSFGTISAYGSNGAVIHYKPSNLTKKKITRDSLYLLDSGGQYKDGTTDVTRTLHYGSPTEFQKEAYTRVLMGSIDLAKLVFPKGTGDISVDVLARQHLYQVGLDYNHGTGHGIGMFLNVHEAPVQLRIYSKENHKLQLGYFFSDEPGYYKPFEFGIRLETILAVVKAQTKYESGKDFYEFEPITLVPFEPKLINLDMLDAQQCAYLNAYHDLVRTKVGAALEEQGRMAGLAYLRKKTASVECNNLSGAGRSSSCSSAQAATSNDLQSRFSGDYIIANGALTSCRADSNLVVLLVVLFAILSASRFQ